jgi:hypothetical protein
LAQKLVWASQIFVIPHRPNQPAARLRARGFPFQTSQIMHWMYQVSWYVFEAVFRSLGWFDVLNWLKSWFGRAKFSSSHTVQTSLLQDIPNHALDVSSGLACFWSCGLVIMFVGHLELAQKLIWASQIFLIPHHSNHQQAARLRARGFPSQPSKIIHWMYQVAWHVFEAVVRSLWWLDILNWLKSWFGRAKFSSSHIIQTSLLQ